MILLKSTIKLEKIKAPEKADLKDILREKHKLERLLSPFILKRNCFDQLINLFEEVSSFRLDGRRILIYVLDLIRKRFRKKVQKTHIYKMRWDCLRQLNREISEEFQGAWPMEKSLCQAAAVKPKIVRALLKERAIVQAAESKYKKIELAIHHIDTMKVCVSIQHGSEHGCPTCGVIYIGAAKSMYVEAVDRDDGTITLRPLEFELKLLIRDKELQGEETSALRLRLRQMEEPLKEQVAGALQNWLCCRLSRQRNYKCTKRFQRSVYYYRIRRLVVMKSYIDELFRTVKHQRLLIKMNTIFKDLSIEYAEYSVYLVSRRQKKINRIWGLYIENLKLKMLRTKLAKFALEESMKLELLLAEKLRQSKIYAKNINLLRKRLHRINERKYICYHANCNRKIFKTKKRYEIHMSLHDNERRLRKTLLQDISLRRRDNERREQEFLNKLYEFRVHDMYLHLTEDSQPIREEATGNNIVPSKDLFDES